MIIEYILQVSIILQVTPEYCKKVVEHVRKIELSKFSAERIMDSMVDEINIKVTFSSSSEVGTPILCCTGILTMIYFPLVVT